MNYFVYIRILYKSRSIAQHILADYLLYPRRLSIVPYRCLVRRNSQWLHFARSQCHITYISLTPSSLFSLSMSYKYLTGLVFLHKYCNHLQVNTEKKSWFRNLAMHSAFISIEWSTNPTFRFSKTIKKIY